MAGKRKEPYIPRSYHDVPFVSPTAKAQRQAVEQRTAAASKQRADNAALEKSADGKCAIKFACAECGGTSYWGRGPGNDPQKLGRAYKDDRRTRIWLCGASKCRKVLPQLDAAAQAKAKEWADLVEKFGMKEAKELWKLGEED